MIDDVDIHGFRCFEHLTLEGCRRFNVVVGDNGSGKTALLEAVFLALGSSSELVIRYRQMRGLDGAFRASSRRVADALINDLFFDYGTHGAINISLKGSGVEARSLEIIRTPADVIPPTEDSTAPLQIVPARFIWTDSEGKKHPVSPRVSTQGLHFGESGEDVPDFFYFGSNAAFSSTENAERFSDLSRARRQDDFVKVFSGAYPWVEDLRLEMEAGVTSVYATVMGLKDKMAVASVSGGINRIMTILLAIASRRRSVVLVDEMESGLYYRHHKQYWKAILRFARDYESQIFVTTHSKEWLEALILAAGDRVEDIALWRLERGERGSPILSRFDGAMMKDAIEYGAEPRGE
jgi:predicted ATPase